MGTTEELVERRSLAISHSHVIEACNGQPSFSAAAGPFISRIVAAASVSSSRGSRPLIIMAQSLMHGRQGRLPVVPRSLDHGELLQ